MKADKKVEVPPKKARFPIRFIKGCWRLFRRWFPLLVIAFLCLWIALPWMVNTFVIPAVTHQYGLTHTSVHVQSVTPFSAGVGPVVIGERRKAPLRIENLQVTYSPWELLGALTSSQPIPFDSVNVSGINLSAQLDDHGNLTLDTTEWEHLLALVKPQADTSATVVKDTAIAKPAPVVIRELRLLNTHLRLRTPDALYWVSATLIVNSPDSDILKSQSLSGNILLDDQQLRFRATNPAPNAWQIDYTLNADLALLRDFLPDNMNGRFSGLCAMEGQVNFAVKDGAFKLGAVKTKGEIKGLGITLRKDGTSLLGIRHSKNQSFTFDIERRAGSGIVLNTSDIYVNSPASAIARLNVSILPDTSGAYELRTIAHALVKEIRAMPDLKLGQGIAIRAEANGTLRRDVGGRLMGTVDVSPQSSPVFGDIRAVFADTLRTEFIADIEKGALFWQCASRPVSIDIAMNDLRATVGKLRFNANNDNGIHGTFGFTPSAEIPGDMNAAADEISSTFALDSQGAMHGLLTLLKGSFEHPQAQVKGIEMELPWQWPHDPGMMPDTGRLTIADLLFDGEPQGTLKADLVQRGQSIGIHGGMKLKAIENFKTGFNVTLGMFSNPGKADAFGIRATVEAVDQLIPDTTRFGDFMKSLEGFSGGGRLSVKATLPIMIPGEAPHFELNLNDGVFRSKEMNMQVDGVRIVCALEQGVTGWRTPAGQFVTIDSLRVGTFHANDFRTDFRLEENGDVRVEGVSFKFCDGEVRSLAMNITPGVSKYRIILHCDNLLMRDIFVQANLGAALGMEGDARISGLIPVDISGADIRLGKGYLQTSPGIMGRVKLQAGNEVFGALPMDHPGFGQIEFSRLALSDFNYDWIKLNLSMYTDTATQTEMYLLKLTLFGKPAAPLPFVYNPSTGSFVKLQTGGTGIMQDMQLDLNLRSDVKILELAMGFKKFFDELQNDLSNPFKKAAKKKTK